MRKGFTLVLVFLLTACRNDLSIATLPDPVPVQTMNTTEEGLSLSLIQTHYKTSPNSIETVIRNDSLLNYEFGAFYHIEVKWDDEWYMITYSDAVFLKDESFRDFGKIITPDSEVHQIFSIEALGIILPPGEYRLVKTFLYTGKSFHEISVAAPFKVN